MLVMSLTHLAIIPSVALVIFCRTQPGINQTLESNLTSISSKFFSLSVTSCFCYEQQELKVGSSINFSHLNYLNTNGSKQSLDHWMYRDHKVWQFSY